MKGYKAFKKGLICDPTGKNPFQYAENTIFETNTAELCKSGFHFCKNPFYVLDCYPLIDNDGKIVEFAEVEALDDVKTNNIKYCTKKLKVGKKISFSALIQAGINFELENKLIKNSQIQIANKDYARVSKNDDYVIISNNGDFARISSIGSSALINNSGISVQISHSGNSAKICNTGNYTKIGSTGNTAQIINSGNSVQICNNGYSTKISSSGDYVHICSSGDFARITSNGKHSIICCTGNNSSAKGRVGNWITLSEWKYIKEIQNGIWACKTEFVDGEKIKEDTFYELKNGEFVESKMVNRI